MNDLGIHPRLAAFLLGFLGGIGTEVILIVRAYERNSKKLPGRYKAKGFWAVRTLLALFSGVIAWAYYNDAAPPILYVHVGAATEAILTTATVPGGREESSAGNHPVNSE
jgi:hypothetical protein